MSAVDDLLRNGGDSTPAEPALTPDAGNSPGGLGDDDDGDLFGDDDDEQAEQPLRKLDDSELDSGDDEDRADRVQDTVEEDVFEDEQEKIETVASIARVNYPEGEDLYLLNVPPFLAVRHRNFDYDTYEIPDKPHDGDEQRKFSPFSTAMTTMFWRHDPKNTDLLQSNARIVKWSDGSMTLQLATKPNEQYRIEPKGVRQSYNARHSSQAQPAHYDPSKDSHMFLAASHNEEGVALQLVRAIDATMRILPSGDLADESVQRLKASLAAVKETHDPLARLKTIEEDPEIAKKAAEAFEKEKARAIRKREAAEDRTLNRRERVLGRSGFGGGRSAGLSIAGLEDDDGMPQTYGKSAKRRKTNRKGEIYSDDDEEGMPRGGRDEYDREDDFLASSDEEPEVYDDGDEEEILDNDDPDRDDLEIEGRQTVIKDRTRGSKGRRQRMDEIEDEDDDAEGEEDTELLSRQALPQQQRQGSPLQNTGGAGRKRRVIDDDEDDE